MPVSLAPCPEAFVASLAHASLIKSISAQKHLTATDSRTWQLWMGLGFWLCGLYQILILWPL